MVRLREHQRRGIAPVRNEFQFQNGTIKRVDGFKITALDHLNFNSKMVRLRENSLCRTNQPSCLFQFQNGTIKSDKSF